MKALAIVIFCFLGLLDGVAQYVAPEVSSKPKWLWHENLFYGGGLGLGFGNVTAVNANPQVGVRMTKHLGAGVGFDYNFVGRTGLNIQTFGPSAFVRAKPLPFLVAQAEYVHVFASERFNTIEAKYNFPMFLLGGGYFSGTENGGFFMMLMWDLIGDPISPFPDPMFRAGVSIGF